MSCMSRRLPPASRLECVGPPLAVDDVAPKVGADSPLEDKAVLILATMPVHRCCQCARLHGVLHERETPARLGAVDHEPHADTSQLPKLAIARTHDPNRDHCHS